MSEVILQNPGTHETRAVRLACMLLDNMVVHNSTIDKLDQYSSQLKNGALPVGSVEFVRCAMEVANIQEPENISYPTLAMPYLRRNVEQCQLGDVDGKYFIKPVSTKLFNGFVHDSNLIDMSEISAHDIEQYSTIKDLPKDTLVWRSDPVQWLSEWRYYVAHGFVIGSARYDDGSSEAEPDVKTVRQCIRDLNLDHPYVLDFGVLSTGETALVEVNDAWAIGLYGKALDSRDYFYFLRSRWRLIHNTQGENNEHL